MHNYNFYYVSLSDGDGSVRVRYIQSARVIPDAPGTPAKPYIPVAPHFSLTFIMDGDARGHAYLNDSRHFENTTLFTIAFDGIHCKKLLSDSDILPDKGELIKIYDFDRIKKIHSELAKMYPEGQDIQTPEILSQITAKSFLYLALRTFQSTSQARIETQKRILLVKAENYMRENFASACTIDELSHHLSIDRRYLYKLFKKHSGISPKQYLSNIKISYACDLLLNTDLSVGDIAEKIGYSDMLQFSAFFKKQTGLSPMKYRTRNM